MSLDFENIAQTSIHNDGTAWLPPAVARASYGDCYNCVFEPTYDEIKKGVVCNSKEECTKNNSQYVVNTKKGKFDDNKPIM